MKSFIKIKKKKILKIGAGPCSVRALGPGLAGLMGNPALSTAIKTHTLCGDLCLKNLKCTHFTWNALKKVCYLRQASNPYPISVSAIAGQRLVCGYVNHRNPPP